MELVEELSWFLQQEKCPFEIVRAQLRSLDDGLGSFPEEDERALDEIAWEIRRVWIDAVRQNFERIIKSPPIYPSGERSPKQPFLYDYERFGVQEKIQRRIGRACQVPPAWNAEHFVFSNGMAACSAIYLAISKLARASYQATVNVTSWAGYFESLQLFSMFNAGDFKWSSLGSLESDVSDLPSSINILHIEPLHFDGDLTTLSESDFVEFWARCSSRRSESDLPWVVVFDTTPVANHFQLQRVLESIRSSPPDLVINIQSGLKLHQQGLELANIGMASVFSPTGLHDAEDKTGEFARDVNSAITEARILIGAGLSLDAAIAIQAPFFTDVEKIESYSNAVFNNNRKLAQSISAGRFFSRVVYPGLEDSAAAASCPVVMLHLSEKEREAVQPLIHFIQQSTAQQKILFEQGLSFGFRSHRYEAFTLHADPDQPVLRIAMGARTGPSVDKIINLLQEIAYYESFRDLPLI